jgi:hypothetical protein
LSPKRVPKTFEELVTLYAGRYRHLPQYKDWTEEQILTKARSKALQVQEDAQIIEKGQKADAEVDQASDEAFRQERMAQYEQVYGEWDDAGDQALLINLVELEVQFRAIRRDLTRATQLGDKEKYWKALRENSEAQKNLQVTLGIDKKSRELTRATGNPMDNWQQIKDELGDWVDMLVEEFTQEAETVNTEQELKDLMKVKLSWPFAVIDSVVYNLKRVNGYVHEESENL